MSPRLAPVVIVCAALLARVARAEGSIATDEGRAQALKTAELAAGEYKAEHYAAALEKFEEAYRVFPATSLLSNLSHTEFKLQRCDDAVDHARQYAASQPPKSEAGIAAEEWYVTVKAACPEIEVITTPPGATLLIEGAPEVSRITPWKERLPAGTYPITLRQAGFIAKRDVLNVSPGAPVNVTLTLQRSPNAPVTAKPIARETESEPVDLRALPPPDEPKPTPPVAKPMPATHVAGWALVGAGGVGVLTGAIVGLTALADAAALRRTSVARTTASSDNQLTSINERATVAVVLLGAGAAVGGVGVVFVVAF